MDQVDQGLEVSGKTVDEAVEDALAQLGLSRDEIEVEILDEGARGRLGIGSAPARIIVRPLVSPNGESRNDDDDDVGDDPDVQPGASSSNAVNEAVGVLRELLRYMDIPAEVTVRSPQTPVDGLGLASAVLDITGDDVGLLIGRRGATLGALQYIVNILANQGREGRLSVTVDIEGYRRRRERTLNQLAHRAAERVIATGEPVEMEPMPANERRIVHIALSEYEGIGTKSIGGGEDRRIVVSPAD